MNKRYTWEVRETKLGEAQVVVDNTKEDCWYGTAMSICEILNCKEERIKELEEENEQLRKDKEQLKERLRECGMRVDKLLGNCR